MGNVDADITRLLHQLDGGVPGAADRLYAVVYDELRRNASAILRRVVCPGQPGGTLGTTGLVHEAYLRFRDQRTAPRNRGQFFGIVTRCMRRALADYIRSRKAKKRGGDRLRVPLDTERDTPAAHVDLDLLLDAIDALERQYPWESAASGDVGSAESETATFSRKAVIATLRHVMGCSGEDIASQLGLPSDEVEREWIFARAFLRRRLTEKKP